MPIGQTKWKFEFYLLWKIDGKKIFCRKIGSNRTKILQEKARGNNVEKQIRHFQAYFFSQTSSSLMSRKYIIFSLRFVRIAARFQSQSPMYFLERVNSIKCWCPSTMKLSWTSVHFGKGPHESIWGPSIKLNLYPGHNMWSLCLIIFKSNGLRHDQRNHDQRKSCLVLTEQTLFYKITRWDILSNRKRFQN